MEMTFHTVCQTTVGQIRQLLKFWLLFFSLRGLVTLLSIVTYTNFSQKQLTSCNNKYFPSKMCHLTNQNDMGDPDGHTIG